MMFPDSDERSFIEAVLEQGDFIPHFTHADSSGPLTESEQFFKYVDEPLIGNAYLIWGSNRAANHQGVRIVLNGFDGDTTVSHGVMYLTELARRREWKTLITEANTLAQNFENPDYPSSEILCQHSLPVLKNLAQNRKWVEFIRAVNHLSEHIKISRQKLILDYAVKPLVPGFISKFLRAFSKGKQSSRKGLPFINPVFAQRINLEERKQSLKRFFDQPTTDREKQWRSLTSGLLTIPIETVDLISSPFKIEPRFPFMDKRLIEFCLSLPPEQKLNQG